MKKVLFKQFFIAFLLFVITGAFFFCAFAVATPMSNETHAMPATQGMPMSHSTHLGELSLTTVAKDSFALDTFLLGVVFAVFFAILSSDVFRKYTLVNYLRQKFFDIIYYVQKITHDWLSLFELSPSFA